MRQSTPAAPASTALRADVADPVGDALSDPRLPVAPDIVRATATATVEKRQPDAGGVVRARHFRSADARVSVLLDTDQNPATGIRQSTLLGADFTLDLFAPNNQTAIGRVDEAGCAARQSCFVNTGSSTLALLPDGMQAVVPLSALGNTSGRIAFVVNAYATVVAQTTVICDWAPDTNLPAARTQ